MSGFEEGVATVVGTGRVVDVTVVVIVAPARTKSTTGSAQTVQPSTEAARTAAATPSPAAPTGWDRLSDREMAVARLVGRAMTNQQIATRLCISPHTVNYHLRQIFQKLDLRSRVQLARLASMWS